MLGFFTQFAELLEQALAYLELDEGYEPKEIQAIDVEISTRGVCIIAFPEIDVTYFASNWNSKNADWLFLR